MLDRRSASNCDCTAALNEVLVKHDKVVCTSTSWTTTVPVQAGGAGIIIVYIVLESPVKDRCLSTTACSRANSMVHLRRHLMKAC